MRESGTHRHDRRKGISEIMGSLLLVAITLIAGAAVFGFVNGQVTIGSSAIGESAASNINFLNEREVIVHSAVVSVSAAKLWIYNYGTVDLKISKVLVISSTGPVSICSAGANMPLIPRPSPSGSPSSLRMIGVNNTQTNSVLLCPSNLAYLTGTSYTFKVVGQFGSTAQIAIQY